MKDKVLVDTNIVIDLMSKRENFYYPAAQLFSLADKNKVELCISSLTFANAYYLISKELGRTETGKILSQFKVLVKILPMDDKIIGLALNSEFSDFEDAVQYYTAIENGLNVIITRNLKDFKSSAIPVMTAENYLSTGRL
ncbi:MAG TPA: PIN domain-containing protein [Clostridiales bacterium]|nr:PIN domain-containing protein [Clostridiales bacterium]